MNCIKVKVPTEFWGICLAVIDEMPYRIAKLLVKDIPNDCPAEPEIGFTGEQWNLLANELGKLPYFKVYKTIQYLQEEISKQE